MDNASKSFVLESSVFCFCRFERRGIASRIARRDICRARLQNEDGTEEGRIDSECPIREVSLDEFPDDCIRLAGSDWAAALQFEDVDNGSPFTKRYFKHGTPHAHGVATSDLLWVNGSVPSDNDVQINPDSGETAFAIRGENSIFVLTKVPKPPKIRKHP